MKVEIKQKVFQKYPQLKIAFILLKGADNRTKLKESQHLLKEIEHLIHLTFNKETIKNHHLIAPWSVAQQEFGKEAKHYHTSVEKLLKKVLKRQSVKTRTVLTNVVRYTSLKEIVPFGVDDISKLNGNLTFNLASGQEKSGVLRSLKKGALYYHDSKSVLGTKLDFWKNKKTALTPNSRDILVHFEALPPVDSKKLRLILNETNALLRNFCGGKLKVVVLSKSKNSAKI